MENTAVMMDLPEGCVANVIGLTTPRDACRLSLISTDFKSAADSDAVWDKFLPPDTNEIVSHSDSEIDAKSKKELYFTLCDPILIDDGKMSGKKCYMIAARNLRIAWGDTPRYWKWKSLPESRFKEAAKLRVVCWLEIRGRIETRMLSPSTTYKAYLVYKLAEHTYGLHWPAVVSVGTRAYGFDYDCTGLMELTADNKGNVFLAPQKALQSRELERMPDLSEAKFPNEGRGDGWLEMELGEFHCQGDEDGELEMICCEVKTGMSKSGLLVQGIEVRPERE
ncbi:hypothetical protein ACLB2K_057575 [Fragaria x ananassa]